MAWKVFSATILGSLIVVFASQNPTMEFTMQGTNKCPLTQTSPEIQMRSKAQCSAICLQRYNCVGFCYNSVAKGCKTSDFPLNVALPNATNAFGYNMYWSDLNGYYRFGNLAYKPVNSSVAFASAKSACSSEGAKLPVPLNLFDCQQILLVCQMSGIPQNVWVDLTDIATEGVWINGITGTPASYFPWYPGEPDGGVGENCGVLFTNNLIYDLSCVGTVNYVCEKLVY